MNLLLIEGRLRSLETFIQGCNENTKYVTYNLEDSFDEVKNKIQNLGVSSFDHVGFVFEDEGLIKTFVSYIPFIAFDENGIKDNLTTQFIKEVIATYNVQTLDFLACDLLLNPTWKSYFEYLQSQNSSESTSLTVRASSNKSGNLQHGGDWILESTNEDVTTLYFNENINNWNFILGWAEDYNAILLNDDTDNLYTCGKGSNSFSNHRNSGDFINTGYIFNKNIIKIESTCGSFAFITDETSNNLYVLGDNGNGKYGLGNTTIVGKITNVTSSALLNKKIISVGFSRPVQSYNKVDYMYVLTDESINNLYSCGGGTNNPYMLGLGNSITTTNNQFQQITYLNQRVLKILCSGPSRCEIITDEISNNIFYLDSNTSGNFIRLNDTILYDKQAIDGECHPIFRAIITSELSNNLYIKASKNGYTGTNYSTLSSYTNISLLPNNSSYELLNKKIEKVIMNDTFFETYPFVLTDETSNNLYTFGASSYRSNLGLGINTNISNFKKVSDYSTSLLNKRVLSVNINTHMITTILTDESMNNVYSCGRITNGFGEPLNDSNNNSYSYTFKNVSLLSQDLLNKYIKLLSGYYEYVGNEQMTIAITNENPLEISNIYVNCIDRYNVMNIDNSFKTFKKIKYITTNKQFIKCEIAKNKLFTFTNESSNNLYGYTYSTIPGPNTYTSHLMLKNLSNIESEISNKKIIDMRITNNEAYLLTNESSNNLYGATSNGTNFLGDGTTNNSSNFKKITNNILNKQIIKISCNNNSPKAILTDESMNNYYVCGISNGIIGDGLTNSSYNVFTNITNNIYGKTFIDVECTSQNTFLISNESSNNLYWCGGGYHTNNAYSNQVTFKKVTNGIYGKKITKVLASGNYIHNCVILTDEESNNLYIQTPYTSSINKIINPITLNKRFIDIQIDTFFTDESLNNVYSYIRNTFNYSNSYSYGIENFDNINKVNFNRLTYLNNKSYIYVPPVVAANVPVIINTTPPTITDSYGNTVVSAPVKYAPKKVELGINNKINFLDPTKTSINIAPVQTTEAVQKYSSVLNVTAKNVVSGYIKLEPAGTTFEKHISLEFDVDPFIQPVVYFKSSTDPAPILIPSSNNSSNDVYYTANTSTGAVTLYTKHFSEAIVTQDQATVNPPVGFVLSNFDTSLAMGISGELFKETIPTMDASAIAEYYVKTSDMRNVFAFQTDSRDINNLSGEDVKYFVRKNQWPEGLVLNPCHAWVQTSKQIASSDKSGLIPDDKQLVKHDFIRYISKSLFNTHLGVDLFQNESELNYDLAYKGHNSAWSSIWNSLDSISDVSLNTTTYAGVYGTDPSYGYFLTNDLSNNSNICRQLLNQVISTAPGRIQDLTPYAIDISSGLFSVPLMDGDSISFKLTLQTAPNQHLLLNSATPIQPRSYQIRVNLRDTVTRGTTHQNGTNLIVNDTLPETYLGSVPTNNLNTSYPANYV